MGSFAILCTLAGSEKPKVEQKAQPTHACTAMNTLCQEIEKLTWNISAHWVKSGVNGLQDQAIFPYMWAKTDSVVTTCKFNGFNPDQKTKVESSLQGRSTHLYLAIADLSLSGKSFHVQIRKHLKIPECCQLWSFNGNHANSEDTFDPCESRDDWDSSRKISISFFDWPLCENWHKCSKFLNYLLHLHLCVWHSTWHVCE